ncbi:hypothetical protein GGI07_002138 [Coemansia sp. Benny D115]|nr:hypothetical protein GGI07_002138 [Coemansia sp. Benny D115]
MTTTTSKPSYIFRYFNSPGLSEGCRLLLTASGHKWTEENPAWPQEKANQPFGQMPVLVVLDEDGKADFILDQSTTIERYLARVHGFMPSDVRQAARQEQLRDQLADVHLALSLRRFVAEDKKATAIERFENLLETLFRVHGKVLQENGNNGHYFGDKLSYIDITAYGFFRSMFLWGTGVQEDLASYISNKMTPEFRKFIATVEADPLLQEHVAKSARIVSMISDN